MNPTLGAPVIDVDVTPGHYGDFQKVMVLIVSDRSSDKECLRTFTTLDGLQVGQFSDVDQQLRLERHRQENQ